MRVFVSGGAGFIGSNFIRLALKISPHCEIVNYDKLTYAGNLDNLRSIQRNKRYSFVRGDVCDARMVAKAMEECDAVVHFAAESHVDRSIAEPEPSVWTNVLGTSVLLNAARKIKVHKFVHISSDEVYGSIPPRRRADESWPLKPNSPYSASKAAADLLVRSFVQTYNFPAVILRPSNNFGPYQHPEKFLSLMITNAFAGKPLPIYGDGLQERDWMHVEDCCRAVIAVLTKGRPGEIYNAGGGQPRRNLEVARQVLELAGVESARIEHVEDRPGHDRRYALDSSKIERELGWRSRIAFEDGLRETVEWYRRNRVWTRRIAQFQEQSMASN